MYAPWIFQTPILILKKHPMVLVGLWMILMMNTLIVSSQPTSTATQTDLDMSYMEMVLDNLYGSADVVLKDHSYSRPTTKVSNMKAAHDMTAAAVRPPKEKRMFFIPARPPFDFFFLGGLTFPESMIIIDTLQMWAPLQFTNV
jgi:hypothetical protein